MLHLKSRNARGASRHPIFMGNCPTISTRVSLIYLVDEFFIFSLLVLLKEMRMWGESKTSSCCFCVWCKSRELAGRRSPRFPCATPVVESFFSDFRATISYWAESHLESCQTSTMELSCEITNGFNTLTISPKSSITDVRPDTPRVPPIEGAINVGCGWTASAWNL